LTEIRVIKVTLAQVKEHEWFSQSQDPSLLRSSANLRHETPPGLFSEVIAMYRLTRRDQSTDLMHRLMAWLRRGVGKALVPIKGASRLGPREARAVSEQLNRGGWLETNAASRVHTGPWGSNPGNFSGADR
jgi:hypothetical protein